MLAATEEDTLVTRAFTGRPARSLRNRFVEEYQEAGPEPLAWPLQSVAAGDIYHASQFNNNGDYSSLFAGQGLRMLKDERGAAEIVEELVNEAETVLSQLSGGTPSEQPPASNEPRRG